jgi:hypothetical protein
MSIKERPRMNIEVGGVSDESASKILNLKPEKARKHKISERTVQLSRQGSPLIRRLEFSV